MRNKPSINAKSRLITKSKKIKPIYERTADILKSRKENLEKLKNEVKTEKRGRERHITFIPNYRKVMKRLEKEKKEKERNP